MKRPSLRMVKRHPISSARERIFRPIPLSAGLFLTSLGLLLYKLLSLVPFGNHEQPAYIGSDNLHDIKQNALFAPLRLMQLAILKVTENDAYTRLASVAVGLTAAVLLYAILRKWYTTRISLLTSGMFITSSWFLHAGRLSNVEVMYLTVVPAMLLSIIWFLSKKNDKLLPIAAVMLALLLYIPGIWILLLAGVIVFRKYIVRNTKQISPTMRGLCAGLFLGIIAPLVYSFILYHDQTLAWLGYNNSEPLSFSRIYHQFINIPLDLLWHGPNDASIWLVGTPVLDIFTIAMLILGIYAYRMGYYPAREKMVFGIGILSILIIGLGGGVTIGLLIPLIYIIVANGLAYMLQSWFTVFPRNPVARMIGIVAITIVVLLSCSYNLQRYFIAWPNAKDTKSSLISQR